MPSPADPDRSRPTAADRALARAARAWARLDHGPAAAGPGSFWLKFAPEARERLAAAWGEAAHLTPEGAWQALLADQRATARFDPGRVHPTWFRRILAAESPAVRALVARLAPGPVRAALGPQAGEGADRPVAPEAADWASTLWSERLVGGPAADAADPPVVAALTQLGFRDQVRLARVAGQAKEAFAQSATPGMGLAADVAARVGATGRVRIAYFRRIIGRADPRLVPLARGDLAAVAGRGGRRYAAVGLVTAARLLKGTDPHRARWAVQHIPYPIARQFAGLVAGPHVAASGLPAWAIRAWELWILEAAWARLLAEGGFGRFGGGGS